MADLRAARRPVVEAAYKEIATFVPDPRLVQVLRRGTPAVQSALADVDDQIPLPRNKKGLIDIAKIDRFDVWNLLKQKLDRIGNYKPRDPTLATLRNDARRSAAEINSILDEITGGEYAVAREAAQVGIKAEQATNLGEKVVRGKDVRDLPLDIDRLGRGAATEAAAVIEPSVQQGAARELLHEVRKGGAALRDVVGRIAAPAQRDAIRRAFPDDDVFASFEEEVSSLWRQAVRDAAVSGNKVLSDLVKDPDTLGRLTPWAFAQSLSGNPALAIAQGLGGAEAAMMRGAQARAAPIILQRARAKLGSREIQGMLAEWGKMNAIGGGRFRAAFDRRPRSGKYILPTIINNMAPMGGREP